MKKRSLFLPFGYIIILWACGFFAASSKTGENLLPEFLSEKEQCSYPQAAQENKEHNKETIFQPVFLVLNLEQGNDLILSSYRDPEFQNYVVAFFQDIARSYDIAKIILNNASAFDIPPALAFALCAEESNFNPRALNRNRNETVDRGLFQLNSASFPQLSIEEFFDNETNVRHGLAYLRRCLDAAGTEVAALAMYNAGAARVRSAGTPQTTLNYISRILNRQRDIEKLFMIKYARLVEERNASMANAEMREPFPFRLSLLAPLGR